MNQKTFNEFREWFLIDSGEGLICNVYVSSVHPSHGRRLSLILTTLISSPNFNFSFLEST